MDVFVMPEREMWIVRWEHSKDVISEHDSREAAIETAKEVSIGQDGGKADGTIDNPGAYGVDPFPFEDNAPEYNDEQDEGT